MNNPSKAAYANYKILLLAVMLVCANAHAEPADHALPANGQVVAGQSSISRQGSSLNITQGSQKAIINWQDYNIGAQASVNYQQPNAGAVSLNRVVSANPTEISGKLNANGQVWLINPNGVVFGKNAQVNAGGLAASTLNITDQDFLNARKAQFNGDGKGAVVNAGHITAKKGGYVAMLAAEVRNEGVVSARQGTVAMAAGEKMTLDFNGDRLINVQVEPGKIQALVENQQLIQADGGHVLMTTGAADSLQASVINNAGKIEAGSMTEDGGVIRLSGAQTVLNSGEIRAASGSGNGGRVEMSGENVGVMEGAKVDVSGKTGGGTILMGGDYQGQNPVIHNAQKTYIGNHAELLADATDKGNGGKVIAWADKITRHHGHISAKGGKRGGNGGFVEVSGKKNLEFTGGADVGAEKGLGGKVLLDPQDIVLNTTTQPSPPNKPNGTPDIAFADPPASGTATVQITDITGFSELFLQATNNITVASTLTMAANNSIRLEANNNIAVNGAVTTSGTGNINLKADADNSGAGSLAIAANITSRAGGINLTGASISRTAGSIATTGAANGNAGNINIAATGAVNLGAAAVTATGGTAAAGTPGKNGGAINISGAGVTATGAMSANGSNGNGANQAGGHGGNIVITSSNGISVGALTGSGGTGGTTAANGGNAGSITLANNTAGNISAGVLSALTGNATGTGTGGVEGAIAIGNTATGGSITTSTLSAAGGINGNGGSIALSSAGNVAVNGTITTTGGTAGAGITAAGRKAGNVTITGSNRSVTGAIAANGGAGLGSNQAGGNAGAVSITGNGTLTTVAINSQTGSATGTGAGGTAGGITLGGTTINSGALTTTGGTNGNGGNIDVNATGLLTLNGAVASSGGVIAAATTQAGKNAGSITLTGNGINSAAATTTITANGGAGLGSNQAGGNAGLISLTSTGNAIALNTGAAITSSTGAATGTGAGGVVGGLTITAPTITSMGALTTTGGANGNGGAVNVTSTAGSLSIVAIAANGGAAIAGSAGKNAGMVTLNSAGTIAATTITANGSAANGAALSLAGGNGAAVALTGVGGVTTTTINASGGAASTTNGNGGNAGNIAIGNSGSGNITVTTLTSQAGAAQGTGAGGTAGNIVVNNTATGGNIGTTTISTAGTTNAHGGDVLLSALGDVTVNGTITTTGGAAGAGVTAAGRNAGKVTVTGVNRSVTGAIAANGAAGLGSNQAGGNAGVVAIAGSGTLNTAAINAQTGAATGTGAGGTAGGIMLGGTIINSGALTTTGGANGNGGVVNVTSTAGSLSVGAITASGGTAIAGTAGRSAGAVTLNSTGTLTAGTITANGTSGVVAGNQNGGNGGAIQAASSGGSVTVGAISAIGGNGAGTNANGGNAGSVTLNAGGATPTITMTGVTTTGGSRVGTGIAGSGGNLSVLDAALLSANTTISTTGGTGGGVSGTIGFSNNINSLGTNRTLTINSTATTALDGAIGNTLALASLTTNTGGNTLINGGSVTTTGAQTYGDAVSTGGNPVIFNAGTGTVTATNSANNFANLAVTAGSAGIRDSNAIELGATSITGAYSLQTAGAVTQSAAMAVGGLTSLNVGAGNDITLNNAGNDFGAITVSSGRDVALADANALGLNASIVRKITAQTLNGNLTLNGAITATGTGSGTSVALAAAGNFINSGNFGLTPGGGSRWLVYSTNPTLDTRGAGLLSAYNFKQYNTTYPGTILGSGNGFIYSIAPTITANLGGSANKVYDGTTTASISGLTLNQTGAIDGDTVNLSALTSAAYADKNAGSGKTLTSNALNITGAGNSGKTVYGYTLASPTASGAVGEISRRAISSISGITANDKVYDGSTTAGIDSSAAVFTNQIGGDNLILASGVGAFADKNVGVGKVVSISGLTLGGTDAANYSLEDDTASTNANISQRTITVTAANDSKTYDGTASSVGVPTITAGSIVTGDSGSFSQSFDNKNAGTGKMLIAAGTVKDGNGGGNYALTLVADNAGTINKANLSLNAVSDSKTYDGGTTSAGVVATIGLAGDDTVSGLSQSFASKNVLGTNGSTLNVNSGFTVNDGNGGNNYAVSQISAAGSITPASLSLNAGNDIKIYDGATTSNGVVTTSGLVGGDAVTGLSQSFASKNVLGTNGSTLNVNSGFTVNDGNGGNNYAVSQISATGSITPAALTINADNLTKTYGQELAFSGREFTSVGLVTGETIGKVDLTSQGANGFADVEHGPYVIGADNAIGGSFDSNNYTITYNSGSLTVNRAALLISANDAQKFQGTPNPVFGASYAGFVNGEDSSVLNGALNFSTPAVVSSPAGHYYIRPGGVMADNYAISFANGILSVLVSSAQPQKPDSSPSPSALPGEAITRPEQAVQSCQATGADDKLVTGMAEFGLEDADYQTSINQPQVGGVVANALAKPSCHKL